MSAVDPYFDESFWVNPTLNDFMSFDSSDGHDLGLPEQCQPLLGLPPSGGIPRSPHAEQYGADDLDHSWHHHFAAAQAYGRYGFHEGPGTMTTPGGSAATMAPTPSPPIPGQSWTQSPPSDVSPQSDGIADSIADSPDQHQHHRQHHHHHHHHHHHQAETRPCRRGRRPSGRKPAKGAENPQAKSHNALERNRLAATNFRKRTKESVSKLESVKAKLESEHQELQSEYSKLSYEVLQLKNDLMFHAACQDDKIDIWIKREAQNYTQKLVSDRQKESMSYAATPYDGGGQMNDFSSISPFTTEDFHSLFPRSPDLDGRGVPLRCLPET